MLILITLCMTYIIHKKKSYFSMTFLSFPLKENKVDMAWASLGLDFGLLLFVLIQLQFCKINLGFIAVLQQ